MPAKIILAETFAVAHARLLRDPAFQFALERTPPRPPVHPPPRWLIDLLRLLGTPFAWLAPYAGWLLWGLLAAGVAAILGAVAWEIARRRPGGVTGAKTPRPAPPDWRPDPAKARVLIADADALAAQGRFAEAARLILHRSIAEVEARRPDLVRTDHTSRDIAALERLPGAARTAFALIARHVERGLFALQPLDAAAFAECRRAYADFALPGAWAVQGAFS